MKVFRKLIRIIKIVYTPLSIACILYFAYTNRMLLNGLFGNANVFFIIVASGLWCTLHVLSPLTTKIIFFAIGYDVKLKRLISIHMSRLPARYLPGGIWHTVGRYSDYRAFCPSEKHLSLLLIIETFFPCFITLMTGGGIIWFYSSQVNMMNSLAGGLSLVSWTCILVLPFWIKLKYRDIDIKKVSIQYLKLILTSIFFWIIASISFLFYYSSIAPNQSVSSLFHLAATYIFSWGVGYLAIFAPQGIGVFEVVAGKLMEIPLTFGGTISFMAGFRVVVLFADVTSWSLFKIYNLVTSKTSLVTLDNSESS